VTTDRDGTWNVEEIAAEATPSPRRLTRAFGAASAPAPAPDGRNLFFLSYQPGGVDLHRLALDSVPAEGLAAVPLNRSTYPLAPPERRSAPAPFAAAKVESRPYSAFGAMRCGIFGGGEVSPSGSRLEVNAGGGDFGGRLSWSVGGEFGWNGGTSGGALAARWSGLRAADVVVRAYGFRERPGAASSEPRPAWGRDRWGGELFLDRERDWDHGDVGLSAGGLAERSDASSSAAGSTGRAFGHAGGRFSVRRESERWGASLALSAAGAVGSTGGQGWQLGRAGARLKLRTPAGSFALGGEEGWTGGSPSRFDVFAVGGGASSFSPEADRLFTAEATALPKAVLSGARLETWRAEWTPVPPLALYGAGFRASGGPHEQAASRMLVAGLELRLSVADPPIPIGGRLEAVLGIARILDEPLKNRTVGYLSISVRP